MGLGLGDASICVGAGDPQLGGYNCESPSWLSGNMFDTGVDAVTSTATLDAACTTTGVAAVATNVDATGLTGAAVVTTGAVGAVAAGVTVGVCAAGP